MVTRMTNEMKIRVTRKRGVAGSSEHQRKVMMGIGLRSKIGSQVVLKDTVAIRGMIMKVQHLVNVEMVQG